MIARRLRLGNGKPKHASLSLAALDLYVLVRAVPEPSPRHAMHDYAITRMTIRAASITPLAGRGAKDD
jgi:hypothetical protein